MKNGMPFPQLQAPPQPMVTIPKRDHEYLLRRDKRLTRLEVYGVDNWQSYSEAINDTEGYMDDGE